MELGYHLVMRGPDRIEHDTLSLGTGEVLGTQVRLSASPAGR